MDPLSDVLRVVRLDGAFVACGTGNLAIPAARAGARVTGIDIAPNLIAEARLEARNAGLIIGHRPAGHSRPASVARAAVPASRRRAGPRAGNLGFTVTVVEDATATFERLGPDGTHYSADLMHRVALASLHDEFATVRSAQEVLAEAQRD